MRIAGASVIAPLCVNFLLPITQRSVNSVPVSTSGSINGVLVIIGAGVICSAGTTGTTGTAGTAAVGSGSAGPTAIAGSVRIPTGVAVAVGSGFAGPTAIADGNSIADGIPVIVPAGLGVGLIAPVHGRLLASVLVFDFVLALRLQSGGVLAGRLGLLDGFGVVFFRVVISGHWSAPPYPSQLMSANAQWYPPALCVFRYPVQQA